MSEVNNPEKFNLGEGAVASQCAYCRRDASQGGSRYCPAFPGGVPYEILANKVDHRRPYIDPETGEPGDMGVDLERSITFEPWPDVPAEVLARLYAKLDATHAR